MRTVDIAGKLFSVVVMTLTAMGCHSNSGGGASSANTSPPSDTGGAITSGSEGGATGSGGAVTSVGGAVTSGPTGGGQNAGGASRQPETSAVPSSGGQSAGGSSRAPDTSTRLSGGRVDAGVRTGGAGSGGTSTATSSPIDGGVAPTEGCKIGPWPTADPTKAGPFKTVTENDVGPPAGEAPDGGVAPRFTMFRPQNLAEVELCHPVITWGNGTGSTPNMYGTLLRNFASHGFVVIASNNTNVARGNPAPMLVGVTWVLEQNEDPSSVLYRRLDPTHIGATGHSQGAMATSQASGDSRITTSIPIEGASTQRNLHGPAMFFCGGQDTLVGCNGAKSALAAVTTLPAMYAELIAVDHGSWMSRGNTLSVADSAFTAWMRVHLMGDTALRSWFYGADCKLCMDSAWNIDRKNMDQ